MTQPQRLLAAAVLLITAVVAAGSGSAGHASGSAVSHRLPGTSCPAFPSDNIWHADISKLPVNPRSREWLRHMHAGRTFLHPDFGPSGGYPYGIPITIVGARHRKVRVRFTFSAESDHVRYPLGRDTRIEGGRRSDGDRHAIVVDKSTCTLYETWSTRHRRHGWHAGSGAVWSLTSNRLRPRGWTSADAAGLPILPGLLRYAEVRSGYVDHAIRFTTDVIARRYIWPARHQSGGPGSRSYPPMGARFRLRAGFDISHYSARTRVVLRAMKRYGLILADNGMPWSFQGATNRRWPMRLLDQLKTVPAKAFVAVDESGLMVRRDSGQARPMR